MTLRSEEAPAGLLLAAGEGRRLGRPKATLELDGERLVDRGVRTLRDGGCSPVLVVAGAAQIEVIGAVVVPNPDWRDGMGSSLRAGLAAARQDHGALDAKTLGPMGQLRDDSCRSRDGEVGRVRDVCR